MNTLLVLTKAFNYYGIAYAAPYFFSKNMAFDWGPQAVSDKSAKCKFTANFMGHRMSLISSCKVMHMITFLVCIRSYNGTCCHDVLSPYLCVQSVSRSPIFNIIFVLFDDITKHHNVLL